MAKICFIVGHGKSRSGGYDSGAVSDDGKYQEFRIAKEIAKYAQQYYNTNYTEQCDLMNYEGNLYLQERIDRLQDNTYDFIAEIHLNSGGGTGTEVYYYNGSERSKKYAQAISSSIASAFGVRNRGAKIRLTSNGANYFAIIRSTKPTAVLVETLFIDTASDLEKLLTATGQRKCGEAIAKAVASVRNIPVKNPSTPSTPSIPSTKFFKKSTINTVSIVDALKDIGEKSDFIYRTKIAVVNSINDYRGTPEQNTKMLELLEQGKLIKP